MKNSFIETSQDHCFNQPCTVVQEYTGKSNKKR